MAYVTISHRKETRAPSRRASARPEWLKRVYAAMLLPVILAVVVVRPSAFHTDYE